MYLVLVVLLLVVLIGALPTWNHSSGWGPYPSSAAGLLLLVLVLWLLFGAGHLRLH